MQEFNSRDRLILCIGNETGLRITDILHLKRSDVFKGNFSVTERKTKKKKNIKLSAEVIKMAKAYDKVHHIKRKHFLFINARTGKPFTRQAIYYSFDKLEKFLKNTRITPHSMRQTYAKNIMKETKSIEKVRKALNHRSEKITKVYLKPNRRKGKTERSIKK